MLNVFLLDANEIIVGCALSYGLWWTVNWRIYTRGLSQIAAGFIGSSMFKCLDIQEIIWKQEKQWKKEKMWLICRHVCLQREDCLYSDLPIPTKARPSLGVVVVVICGSYIAFCCFSVLFWTYTSVQLSFSISLNVKKSGVVSNLTSSMLTDVMTFRHRGQMLSIM